ncbi:MAG: sulfite exporter TauE/SafE family protein [Pirellulales bacterium]
MIELPLIFVAGVFGSAHCVGMCGPIALALGGASPTWRTNLARQLIYTLGRISTYAVLGAIAGYGGWRLVTQFPSLAVVPAYLSLAAGVVLLYQGALAAGWIRRRGSQAASPCLAASLFAPLFRRQRLGGAFLAGALTGFLPCGLVYGLLAMAAGTANMLHGGAVMATFAVGTAPVMIATGCGASLLRGLTRQRLYYFASWCVVLTGVLCIARGAVSLGGDSPHAAARPYATQNGSPFSIDDIASWCR